jgi:hypothetical protein
MNDETEISYAFNNVIGSVVAEKDHLGQCRYYIAAVKSAQDVKDVWGGWCTHIACFSSTAELPSQWVNYAKCTGFAIGFDRTALQKWCINKWNCSAGDELRKIPS